MGNKIGFQADSETVKLAYVQQEEDNIKFIKSLKSKYLKAQIKWANAIIFLFECTVQEFINYHTSDNVTLLRNQYQKLLSASELIICTNRATMNTLKENKKLQNALTDILMKKFELQHTQRIENSVHAMMILQKNHHQFFHFKHTFSILQLHNFDKNYSGQTHFVKHIPEKFVLVFLRNGITAYRIQQGKKIQRIQGSIIGEKTIASILKFKFPTKTIQQCFDMAFNGGNIKKVDLMVEDIYGKNTQNLGLPGEIVASSLGKYAKMNQNQQQEVNEKDIIRSLITTFAINTANLTALYLATTQLKQAIILADTFHTDKFYTLIQSIAGSYAPGKSIYFAQHAPFMGCLGSAFNNFIL